MGYSIKATSGYYAYRMSNNEEDGSIVLRSKKLIALPPVVDD
jgi:hypothetical protein